MTLFELRTGSGVGASKVRTGLFVSRNVDGSVSRLELDVGLSSPGIGPGGSWASGVVSCVIRCGVDSFSASSWPSSPNEGFLPFAGNNEVLLQPRFSAMGLSGDEAEDLGGETVDGRRKSGLSRALRSAIAIMLAYLDGLAVSARYHDSTPTSKVA